MKMKYPEFEYKNDENNKYIKLRILIYDELKDN